MQMCTIMYSKCSFDKDYFCQFILLFSLFLLLFMKKLYDSHGGQVTWSIIPLKDSHLFKIIASENFFRQKLIINLAILNKWEIFSGIVDK